MLVINKFMVATATIALTLGSSVLFSVNSNTNLNQTETQNNLKTTSVNLIQNNYVVPETKTALEVQNSIISLAVPQSITVIFLLLIVGIGCFLKLKIAHTKFKHSEQ